MAYRDPAVKTRHFIYFFVLLAFMLCWNLGCKELSNHEAFMAIIAKTLAQNPFGTILHYQETMVHVYPFHIRLLALLEWLYPGALNYEWVIRFPTVLFTFALIALSSLYCYKKVSREAALTVGPLIASSFLFARITNYANSELILTFFLTSAWLIYHHLSQGSRYRKWGWWSLCMLCLMLSFQIAGWKVFALFYIPLFIQRKQYRVWQHLLLPQHAVLLILCIIWILLMPGWNMHHDQLFSWLGSQQQETSFFKHLMTFPMGCFIYLLPIGICFWVGFCSWYRTLETNPIFNSYFRRVSLMVLFLLWILPGISPRMMIILLPMLAILHAEGVSILIRRGEYLFKNLWINLWKISFVTSCLMMIFSWLIVLKIITFEDFNLTLSGYPTAIVATFLVFLCLIIGLKTNRYPYFLRIFAMIAILILAWKISILPIQSWYYNPHRLHGQQLNQKLQNISPQEDILILREQQKIHELPGESYYIGYPIIATKTLEQKLEELEQQGHTKFYVLTGGKKPELSEEAFTKYEWEAISEICYVERHNQLSAVTRQDNGIIQPEFRSPKTMIYLKRSENTNISGNEIKVRLYVGSLKNQSTEADNEPDEQSAIN